MTKRTKKDLICFLIGLSVIFTGCFLIFDMAIENDVGVKYYDTENISYKEKVKIFMSIDTCLDDGGCWDYIRKRCEMYDQGYCEKNEQDCLSRNGTWQKDKKYCVLEND